MNNPFMPEFLRIPMAVAGFRARITVQRSHQELTFKSVLVARAKWEASQAELEPQIDEVIHRIGHDDAVRDLIYTNGGYQSLYEDLGATLILIAAGSVERLYWSVGESVFDRGDQSYADGVTFVEAIHRLANQYKHLGEWLHNGPRNAKDEDVVRRLVDNPLRSDAASEFLKRSGFTDYSQFEKALLSCSDGIADPSLLPDGSAAIPSVILRVIPPDEKQ